MYHFNIQYEIAVVPLEEAEAEAYRLYEKEKDKYSEKKYPFLYGSMCEKYRALHHQFKLLEEAYRELKAKTNE